MNYQRIYDQIISRAKSEPRKKRKIDDLYYVYYEDHHIIPRCLDGSNKKDNRVLLTAREHFMCHKLLCEIYDNKKLIQAYWAMAIIKIEGRKYEISMREFERIKLLFIETVSGENSSKPWLNCKKEDHPFFKHKHTEETKKLMRDNQPDKTGENNGMFGKESAMKGKTGYWRGKGGKDHPVTGIKRSRETKDKVREYNLNLPKKQCEWCGEVVSHMTYNRNHGDRCVLYPDYKIEDHLIYCPNCNMVGIFMSNMERYHFDNCKNIKLKEQIQKIIKKLKNQLTLQNL